MLNCVQDVKIPALVDWVYSAKCHQIKEKMAGKICETIPCHSCNGFYCLRIFMVWGWRSCHDCTHTHTHMIHTTYIFCLPCGSSHFRAGTACLVHIFSLHYIDLACMFTASSASRRDSSHFRERKRNRKIPHGQELFQSHRQRWRWHG